MSAWKALARRLFRQREGARQQCDTLGRDLSNAWSQIYALRAAVHRYSRALGGTAHEVSEAQRAMFGAAGSAR